MTKASSGYAPWITNGCARIAPIGATVVSLAGDATALAFQICPEGQLVLVNTACSDCIPETIGQVADAFEKADQEKQIHCAMIVPVDQQMELYLTMAHGLDALCLTVGGSLVMYWGEQPLRFCRIFNEHGVTLFGHRIARPGHHIDAQY